MPDLRGRTLLGTFFHAPECGRIAVLAGALLRIDAEGTIAACVRAADPGHADALARARDAGTLVRLPDTAVVLPGFVDLHVHAPQYPQLGTALDRPLDQWLGTYTFPMEARFADLAFARRAYTALVEDLLAQGTTTALMFATIHREATQLLAEICLERGLRALVGRVAMDDARTCPDFYRDRSVDQALDDTAALVDFIRGHGGNAGALVRPVVTPRFVPACTDALLEGLGALARACDCHVQTHCAESDWAEGYVERRTGMRDAEALDRWGLLTPATVLAHGVLLSPGDMALIRARQTAVAHCPLSNAYFAGAVFPLRAALERGLRVGLGTDIAGGPSASMFDTIRMTVAASRLLEEGVDPALAPGARGRGGARTDWRVAFHLATAGGGAALGLAVGRFEPGCAFDAQLIDPQAKGGTIRIVDPVDDPEVLLEKVLYTASRANIAETWVAGRSV